MNRKEAGWKLYSEEQPEKDSFVEIVTKKGYETRDRYLPNGEFRVVRTSAVKWWRYVG